MRDHSMESLSDYIESLNVDEATRLELLRKLASMREKGLNIMITGATGSGKSSTINALFRADKARVGEGASPETQEIARYDYDGMTLWDTPGLGDGEDADKRHMEAIRRKLQETNNDGGQLIDAVLVVLDAGSRDLGSSYKLINEVVLPGMKDASRVVVALNQADMALKGRHWNDSTNQPDAVLLEKLDEMCAVVRNRIRESTGIDVEPVFYCAGYKEEGEQRAPYNLAKLLARIVKRIPASKRLLVADNMNRDKASYASDDGRSDYHGEIVSAFRESCRDIGESVGETLGSIGGKIGKELGGKAGRAIGDLIGRLGEWLFS